MNGIINSSNDCYIIAVLYCLINDKYFVNFCNKMVDKDENYNSIKFMRELIKGEIKESNKIKKILYILTKDDYMYNNNMQQDAYQCLMSIFNLLHEDTDNKEIIAENIKLLKNDNKEKYPLSMAAWNQYIKTFGYSFINFLYSGQFMNILYCECGHRKYIFEIFNEITIDVTTSVNKSVVDFLKIGYIDELIECEHCKEKKKMKKKTIIWNFPEKMVLVLKRYSNKGRNNSCVKLNKTLSFNFDKLIEYKLYAVINHHGSNVNSGHYTANVNVNNQWYLFNDDIVNKIEVQEESYSCYILFYDKV
jgi:ubiquitin C-terminal hydrolase